VSTRYSGEDSLLGLICDIFDAGADAHTTDGHGNTALMLARKQNRSEAIIDLLIFAQQA
jgi:hypothetical protein